ncbi:hypothetical protein [Actinomadura opuntiae]|uniref:hypothetical protein n=1 Tax=Actinomadura sp. OS1-43 TaxID=604315 RepID=UPI00255AAE87|nr:hypothetical protein [Actinomadura sp. OS1-43]MDL4817756.1 hypothetical protein [Actinomadura sp. OS1-43]
MNSAIFMLLLAVFLSGAAVAVFLFLLVGIHLEEHRMSLTSASRSRTTTSTRRLLGVTVRNQTPDTTNKPNSLQR